MSFSKIYQAFKFISEVTDGNGEFYEVSRVYIPAIHLEISDIGTAIRCSKPSISKLAANSLACYKEPIPLYDNEQLAHIEEDAERTARKVVYIHSQYVEEIDGLVQNPTTDSSKRIAELSLRLFENVITKLFPPQDLLR